jgi:hypothetical protein
LHYYQSRAASELAGAFGGHVWDTLVLRVAYHESAIRHAIIALGALLENFESSSNLQAPQSEFAMQQYGKAIQQVIQLDIAASSLSIDIAVLSCILFTAFESLQGHYKSALAHINSGVKILCEHEERNGNANDSGYVPAKIMRKLLVRLDSQAFEISDDSFRLPSEYLAGPTLPYLPEAFPNIDMATFTFEIIMNRLYHILQNVGALNEAGISTERLQEVHSEHTKLVQYFHSWSTAFGNTLFAASAPATLVLQCYRSAVGIMLQIDPVLGEMVFDQFNPEFEELVTYAEAFISLQNENLADRDAFTYLPPGTSQSSSISAYDLLVSSKSQSGGVEMSRWSNEPTSKPSFTLALGVVAPLYLACSRCRDPRIRRRALHLLATCNRKEGIWDSTLSARVAERIIAIEEAGAGVAVVTAASQIPEHARVCELDTFFGAGRQGRIKYRKSNLGSTNQVDDEIGIGTGKINFYQEVFKW